MVRPFDVNSDPIVGVCRGPLIIDDRDFRRGLLGWCFEGAWAVRLSGRVGGRMILLVKGAEIITVERLQVSEAEVV
ncbi:hypothetical protein ACOKSZ_07135 [Propionibacteriaceae bacterium Y1685]